MNVEALIDRIGTFAVAEAPRVSRPWGPAEDEFLRQQVGYMTDQEIGDVLDRTEIAVMLRRKRDLHLPSPSRHPSIITASQAAVMLGVDSHKITHWVDKGYIPGRYMAGKRVIRLIPRISLLVWAISPKNWVYFDISKVREPKLKRLLALRAQRWGDEWWSSRQVADYHGVTTGDVKRYIKLGRLKSFRLPVSLGGRHDGDRAWSNHFILKSDAVATQFFRRDQKAQDWYARMFSPRADAWLLKAKDELGMTFVDIGKTMKIGKQKVDKYNRGGTNPIIAHRYKVLKLKETSRKRKPRK